ncbi:class 1 fructose-bisphosphatase [Thermodesulforhabdus norvegica]|uniref:Fructose-1,6-bisphosphatase class 1 n=1 Tax=Thermodesulforhabdus norvegica TaxID=39841 RepID=A0A1I4SRY3_9BACT|nr:class 1 fructose-bisphosphatase [Thermodesulforhabdus norvegica]SFM67266.1 fructose-1,6-bisphosphatase I [Thermodesulforhabdus norvegica]
MPVKEVGITVTEHLLREQRETPYATGAFTQLLNELIVAAKIIHREVSKAGLVDILGSTGSRNVYGEQVQKLDDFANHTIIRRVMHTGHVCAIASEEDADIVEVPQEYPRGPYILLIDPLDGSSNIDVNASIGTIFSIHRRLKDDGPVTLDEVLRKGSEQVAAGYFIYGSSTMLVYSTGKGVNGFTLNPGLGEFLLSHPNITMPERGKIYSVNEGNYAYWDEPVRRYVDYLKTPDPETSRPYTSRYIGTLVGDFHRNLLKGGIFMYPADRKDPKKPRGKLRLLFEAAPLAFIAEQAGGTASDGSRRILDLEPETLHDRVPLFIGSKDDVVTAEKFLSGEL